MAKSKPFIFLGGCNRTGTTLTHQILCSASETNKLTSECNIFAYMMNYHHHALKTPEHFTKDFFSSRKQFEQFVNQQVFTMLNYFENKFKKSKQVVLKNPELTLLFPTLNKLLPQSKFVVVVRDPRDTICSMLDVAERADKSGSGNLFKSFGRDMAQYATHYNKYYFPITNNFTDFNTCVLLKYENLLADPSKVIAHLNQTLDISIPVDAVTQDWSKDVYNEQFPAKEWMTQLYGKPLMPNNTQKFKEKLTEAEISIIEEHCADLMDLFGYAPICTTSATPS